MTLHSYSTIYGLGHRAVQDFLKNSVVVQEKVDGSQFSFGVVLGVGASDGSIMPGDEASPPQRPELIMKSKGSRVYPETTDKLFKAAVDTVVELFQEEKLTPGFTYRGEVLAKPKHNTLAYERVPN